LPWLAVHRVTFEPDRQPEPAPQPLFRGFADVASQRSFRMLCAIYLCGRMGMDIAGALFILYAQFWLGRIEDFEPVMVLFFTGILLSFPLAVRLSRTREKARLYAAGAIGWSLVGSLLWWVQPDWPRWLFFLLVPLITPGFAIVDLMPWSMIGEVADEGELETRERRDGVYSGVLSFVRKAGGAVGMFAVFGFLDAMGFVEASAEQTEPARRAVRAVMAFGPALPLAAGAWLALRYPLDRARHARIRAALDARRRISPGAGEAG
jgi:oligogalacturonide transporter